MAARTRRRTPAPEPAARRRPLVAAAAPVDITSAAQVKRITARQQSWQAEAWAYLKSIGTISDVLGYRANVASKVRLHAAWDPPGTDTAPIPVGAAVEEGMTSTAIANRASDVLSRLEQGQGIAAMLHKLFLNLDVPGECHVIGEDMPGGEQQWFAYSNSELRQTSGKLHVLEDPNDKKGRPVAEGAVAFRIWQPDPEYGAMAYSPMRPLVEEGVCERLLIVGNQIRSDLKSRLPKGIVAIAQELSLPMATNADGSPANIDEAAGGGWQEELIQIMTAALSGDGGAADSVPLTIEVPENMIRDKSWADKLDLGQLLDPKILELAEHLVGRVASGLPMPPEFVSGLGDTSHWSAATIERGGFRHYIEPGVLAIVHGLTIGFFRPMLLAEGMDRAAVERLCVWYDESEAITEKDRSEIATEGVKMGAVGRAAWRRVCEFDEEDAPDDDELVKFLGLERSILTAELSSVLLALSKLIPQSAVLTDDDELSPPAPRELPPAPPPPTDEEPPTLPEALSAAGPPVSDVGDRLADIDRRLFDQAATACDMAVEAAIAKAGNKLLSKSNGDRKAKAAIAAAGAHSPEVARVLGRAWSVRLAAEDGQDEDEAIAALLGGAFASLAERIDRMVERAQQQTVEVALGIALPEDRPSDGELATLAAEQADDRERASVGLVAALTALTVSVLFDGAPAEEPGEFDPSVLVPAVVVREALAVAGGAVNVERTAAGGLSVDGRPVGGVATGERSRTLFARVRAWWTGYRWDYGDASARQRPFPPHQALDGRTFARWEDESLRNTSASWLPVTSMSPGDHRGCRCSWVPVAVMPTASESAA